MLTNLIQSPPTPKPEAPMVMVDQAGSIGGVGSFGVVDARFGLPRWKSGSGHWMHIERIDRKHRTH